MGVIHKITPQGVIIEKMKNIKPINIEITVTGVCTDHHPLLVALLLKAEGGSKITEHVWHDRFNYIPEANKFGLNLIQKKNNVIIRPSPIKKSIEVVSCPDLRAAALLVILALAAPGTSLLINYEHLNRGYANFIENMRTMGGRLIEFL